GPASFSVIADDGYSQSAVATVSVNVSDAKLIRLNVDRIAQLSVGQVGTLRVTGDFEDESNVKLAPSYLNFASEDATIARVDAAGHVFAKGAGAVVVRLQSHGITAVNALNVWSIGADGSIVGNPIIDPGLYPIALTLTPGGLRQLRVTDVADQDLSAASAGTRYFVSNPNVISITPDGLVTAITKGVATIYVVNAGGQSQLEVSVEDAHIGSALLTASGGAVQAANGEKRFVAHGARGAPAG